jgi:hypothetical protein
VFGFSSDRRRSVSSVVNHLTASQILVSPHSVICANDLTIGTLRRSTKLTSVRDSAYVMNR